MLCKTVGVVLRWFESITRHAAETAPDQARGRSWAVAATRCGERFRLRAPRPSPCRLQDADLL
jgi:hypothetical protein